MQILWPHLRPTESDTRNLCLEALPVILMLIWVQEPLRVHFIRWLVIILTPTCDLLVLSARTNTRTQSTSLGWNRAGKGFSTWQVSHKVSGGDGNTDPGYTIWDTETQTKGLLSLSEPICQRDTVCAHCEGCSKDDVKWCILKGMSLHKSSKHLSLIILFIILVISLVPKKIVQPGSLGIQGQSLYDAKTPQGAGGGELCWTIPPPWLLVPSQCWIASGGVC